MFTFDCDKLSIHHDTLETISKATIAPKISFRSSPNARFELPFTCARKILGNTKKISRPLIEFPVCYVKYEDQIVCAAVPERKQLSDQESLDRWKQRFVTNINKLKKSINDKWMFDGEHVFFMTPESERRCDNFRLVFYRAFNLAMLSVEPAYFYSDNMIGFQCHVGDVKKTTGPLFKRNSQKYVRLNQDTVIGADWYAPSLRFVLFCANELSRAGFDYETLEPLGIPLLMKEHDTFNLRDLSQEYQMVHRAHFGFDHAIFWLTGLIKPTLTIKQYAAIGTCLNMLLSKKGVVFDVSGNEGTLDRVKRLRSKLNNRQPVDLSAVIADNCSVN